MATQLREDVGVLDDIVRRLPPAPLLQSGTQHSTRQQPLARSELASARHSAASRADKKSGRQGVFWILALLFGGTILVVSLDDPSPHASSSSSPAVARPAAPQTSAPTPAETAPPPRAGRALTTPELRYCVFQSARLDHLNPMLSSTSEIEVSRFNALIHDFNARCGNFTYRSGALAPVQAEARQRDVDLQRQASAILAEWRGAAGATPSFRPPPATPPTAAPPQPPRLLDLRNANDARIVQRRLQELGHYQARIDGGFGALSVAALRAFKRDHPQLPADDEWDLETQRALLSQ
jgi:hypothetical protein